MFKKVISLLTMCTILVGTIGLTTSTFGLTEINVTQSNVYSVDQAMDMAAKEFDRQVTTTVDKLKMSRQIDTLNTGVNNLMTMGILSVTDRLDKTDPLIDSMVALRNGQDAITDGEGVQREAIKDVVRNLFITIAKLETQEKMLDKQIAFNEKLLKLDRKKVSSGLMGTVELEKNFNGYQKVIRQRNALHIGITKLYASLKDLMGVSTEKMIFLNYNFISDVNIVPVSHISQQEVLESKNVKITALRKNLQRAKDFNVGVRDRYPKGSDNIKDADLDLNKAELSLNNAVDALAYKYESAYQQVMDMYETVGQKQKDYELKKVELKVMEKKFKSGAASQYELDGQKTATEAAELDLKVTKIDYVLAYYALESTLKGTNQN